MARFSIELPNDLIKEFEKLSVETPEMMGEMTKAGAEVVEKNVINNMSRSFKSTDRLKKCLFVSKTYPFPSLLWKNGINHSKGFLPNTFVKFLYAPIS